MQSVEGFSGNFDEKENKKDLANPDKTVTKISSLPFGTLGSFALSCLKKFGILRKKRCKNFSKAESEVERKESPESEIKKNRKSLIGIEVYMPIVDVENNTLIPPEFDRPIFIYRETENDEEVSETSDATRENSNINTMKKRRKFTAADMNKQQLKTSGMAYESSSVNIIDKRNKIPKVIKDIEKNSSKINQMFKLFKNKNLDINPEINISSKNQQSNTPISLETSKIRSSIPTNYFNNKASDLESFNKSKQKLRNTAVHIEQKTLSKDFRNKNSCAECSSDIKSNIMSNLSIKSISIKNRKISPSSSANGFSQPFEPGIVLTNSDITKTKIQLRSETFHSGDHKTNHKHEELKANDVGLTNHMKNHFSHKYYAETTAKLSQPSLQLEKKDFRRHLPIRVNINRKEMSSSLSREESLTQNRFSRATNISFDESRTTFRKGKKGNQKQTRPNSLATVAGRRRLIQLMTSGE